MPHAFDQSNHPIAELSLAKVGLVSATLHLFLLGIFSLNAYTTIQSSKTLFALVLGLVSINIFRIILCLAPKYLPRIAQNHFWKFAYRAASLAAGLSWGFSEFTLIRISGFSHNSSIVGFVLVSGLASWCSLSLSHAPRSARSVITLMLIPVVLALSMSHDTASLSIAFSYFLYFLFLQLLISNQQRAITLSAERLSQYEALASTSFEGIIISRNGKVLEASAAMLKLHGSSREEFIGLTIENLISPKDRIRIKAASDSRSSQILECDFIRADGSEIPTEAVRGTCVYNREIADVVCIRDISARKKIEDSLRKSEDETRRTMLTAFDSLPAIVWILDPYGMPKFFNKQGNDYFGADASVFTGGWENYIHPEDLLGASEGWEAAISNQSTCEVSFRLKRVSDGAYRWQFAVSSALRDRNGVLEGWVGSCLDIEESKVAASEKAEAIYRKNLAIESDQLKSEFLANMSHEIRTPLNGIIGTVEFLMDEAETDSQKKYSRLLLQSSQKLRSIVNDVLDFSKIEAGKIDVEMLTFSVSELVEGQRDLVTKLVREKDLKFETRVDQLVPTYVIGDAGRIGQVLLNLITNAIKFTSAGSVSVTVLSEALDSNKVRVRFSVTDTGIGLESSTQEKLFKPFSQADSSTARKFGGTGLGLSISRGLVELMGGEIGVESEYGHGSEFWFYVDLDIGSAPKVQIDYQSGNTPSEIMQKRILIAEDNSTNQILAVANVQRLGHTAQVVANGQEALEALAHSDFDLILMDCHMPEMDGFETTRSIRKLEEVSGRRIPIVALTASARSQDESLCHEAGMDDFLSKPLRREQLAAVFAKWLKSQ